MSRKPLREKDLEKWREWPDRKYSRKKISTWIVELFGGTDRGGTILLWEKTEMGSKDEVGSLAWQILNQDQLGYFKEDWNHVKYKGNHYELLTTINFWHWENAKMEYKQIDTVSDMMNLATRNM